MQQLNNVAPLGIIAGAGKMPALIVEELKRLKKPFFLLAIQGVTSAELAASVDDVVWIPITKIGKAIRVCLEKNCSQLIMAGLVKHVSLFSLDWRFFDWTTIKFSWNLKDWRTDSILKGLCDLFLSKGIEFLSSVTFLKKFMPSEGCLTKISPTNLEWKDIFLGSYLAKKMGELDIGQTVVIKKGSVVAVEAIEGTDRCLERSFEIGGKGCVVIKMSKPHQDLRFDVPVIGLNTIEKLAKIQAAGIAIEADKTLLLDPQAIELANQKGLFIVCIHPEKENPS